MLLNRKITLWAVIQRHSQSCKDPAQEEHSPFHRFSKTLANPLPEIPNNFGFPQTCPNGGVLTIYALLLHLNMETLIYGTLANSYKSCITPYNTIP